MPSNKTWIGTDGAYRTSGNWSTSGEPVSGDNIRLPAGALAISSSLDASGSSIGDFSVEDGFTATIASSSAYLQILPNSGRFVFAGTGKSYINLLASGTTAYISDAAQADTGERGLYLLANSTGTNVFVNKGAVGLAWRFGETSTVSAVRVGFINSRNNDAGVWAGAGCTMQSWQQTGGNNRLAYASTTLSVTVEGGSLTMESTAITSQVTVNGGTVYPNGPGGITTLVVNSGTVDLTKSVVSRTINSVKLNPRATLKYNPLHVTIVAWSTPDFPVSISVSDP